MTDQGERFRALHIKSDPFIMVNVWDSGTAKMMAAMGAKALATSSAAHAFTLGRPDGGTLTRDEALAHAADIVAATDLPVQGDFENGFGEAPEICAQTVRMAAEVGLAGICIEDTTLPDQSAYAFDLAVERIGAAASAARALSRDFVLTARADGILTGAYDTDEALSRLKAFEKVGADCLYAPLPPDMTALARMCSQTTAPVNALIAGPFNQYDRSAFAKIGVARLSLGSSLARITHRVMHDAAKEMFGEGRFDTLQDGISSDIIDAFLK